MEAQKSLKEDPFLWILLIVALVSVGGYYFYLSFSHDTQSNIAWIMEGVQSDTIRSLRRFKSGQLKVSVDRNKSGDWTLSGPPVVRTDTESVGSVVDTLLDPQIIRQFKPSTQADYGFSKTADKLLINTKTDTHVLYLGQSRPVQTGVYVRYGRGTESPIFLLDQQSVDELRLTVNGLRRKNIVSMTPSDISGVELKTAVGEPVEFVRSDSQWNVDRPGKKALSDTNRRHFSTGLQSMTELSADQFYDSQAKLDTTTATITFTDNSGDRLRFKLGGKRDGNRLVHPSDWPIITTSKDPAGFFESLKPLPDNWPESIAQSNPPTSRSSPPQIPGN